MGHQAEDISKIEDIGQRLDALLDALETSAQEVSKVGSSLDVPLDQLRAQELASKPGAMVDDSGRVIVPSSPRAGAVSPAPPEGAPEALETGAAIESPAVAIPEGQPEAQPEVQAELESEPEPVDAFEPESVGVEAEEEDGPIVDDGLLIEPEAQRRAGFVDDIDGAPAGPTSLEDELDEELDALLSSGMFEDPLQEAGIDESAAPVVLAEEAPKPQVPAPEPGERRPNLPTDEAELIGELDEQLAALAEMQLTEPESPEPARAPSDVPAEASAPRVSEPEARPPAKPVDERPAPEVVTRPVAPPTGRGAWRARADRAAVVLRPLGERALAGARRAAIAGATRSSAPLRDKPAMLQIVGWMGLVHLFMAACVWAYLLLWHNPPPPVPAAAQPTLQAGAR